MEKFKGTKGEWSIHDTGNSSRLFINSGYIEVCDAMFNLGEGFPTTEQGQENAKLIADAGKTINKCDLFPSELLEQRDELLEVLEMAKNDIRNYIADKFEANEEKKCLEFMSKNKTWLTIEKVLKQKQ